MRRTIEDVLIDAGLMDEARLRRVRRFARHNAVCLVRAAVEHGGLDEEELAATLAEQLRLPRVDFAAVMVDDDAVREVPFDLAEQRRVLPLGIDRSDDGRRVMRVAMADPLDFDATEEIEMSTGCRVEPLVARVSEVADAVMRYYRGIITKMIPRRAPFGVEAPTQPHHLVADEASAELGLRALVGVLADKGVIDREDWQEAVRKLVKEAAGE
jgi:hypothetical protein